MRVPVPVGDSYGEGRVGVEPAARHRRLVGRAHAGARQGAVYLVAETIPDRAWWTFGGYPGLHLHLVGGAGFQAGQGEGSVGSVQCSGVIRPAGDPLLAVAGLVVGEAGDVGLVPAYLQRRGLFALQSLAGDRGRTPDHLDFELDVALIPGAGDIGDGVLHHPGNGLGGVDQAGALFHRNLAGARGYLEFVGGVARQPEVAFAIGIGGRAEHRSAHLGSGGSALGHLAGHRPLPAVLEREVFHQRAAPVAVAGIEMNRRIRSGRVDDLGIQEPDGAVTPFQDVEFNQVGI